MLCVDKTGTITEDSMCVSEVVKAKAYDEEKMPDLNRMIGDFVKGMDADNSTMHAMQEHFTEHSDKVPEKVIPFFFHGQIQRSNFQRSGICAWCTGICPA